MYNLQSGDKKSTGIYYKMTNDINWVLHRDATMSHYEKSLDVCVMMITWGVYVLNSGVSNCKISTPALAVLIVVSVLFTELTTTNLQLI